METLPHDLVVKVFAQLSVNEIILCSSASKTLSARNYEDIWMAKCLEFGIKLNPAATCGELIRTRFVLMA